MQWPSSKRRRGDTTSLAPGTIELIQNEFSTTGPVERVVSHITLMDTVQHYFTYTMCCGCGIELTQPTIRV